LAGNVPGELAATVAQRAADAGLIVTFSKSLCLPSEAGRH
jgi:hypothetical protein